MERFLPPVFVIKPMTNSHDFMTQQLLTASDQLSQRGPWSLFILMFILWLIASGFAIKWAMNKGESTYNKLLESEKEKLKLATDFCATSLLASNGYSTRLEEIVKTVNVSIHGRSEAIEKLTISIVGLDALLKERMPKL